MSSPARLDLKSPSSTLASPKTPLTPETPEFDELPVFTPIQPHLTPRVVATAAASSRGLANPKSSCTPGPKDEIGASGGGGRPFLSVAHPEENVPFDSNKRKCFLPDQGVRVSIVNHERRRSIGRAAFSHYLYTVEVTHGSYKWTVFRSYTHFVKLNAALHIYALKHPRKPRTVWNSQDQHLTSANNHPVGTDDRQSSFEDVCNPDGEKVQGVFKGDNGPPSSVFVVDDLAVGDSRKDLIPPHLPTNAAHDHHNLLPASAKFPRRPEMMLGADDIKRRVAQLENYLNAALQYDEYRNHSAMLEFLEVSEFSFVRDLVCKTKEGMVRKRVGDTETNKIHHRFMSYLKLCFRCFTRSRWRRLWLIIQETCVVGINPRSGEVNLVLLFDTEFKYSSGKRQTDVSRDCMKLTNLSRVFYMETINHSRVQDWTAALDKLVSGSPGRDFVPLHGQVNPNRSFAPVREDQVGYWFTDGQAYFSAVYDVIQSAKEEVFITDWWLSPEVYLKRGEEVNEVNKEDSRLDRLLKKKASQGVRIFILLYKELTLALGLNSMYTKKALQGRNIRVLRHPDRIGNEDFQFKEFLWAHHEKIVVVDQSYAFVGGIDLCYGRWDTNGHPLTDLPLLSPSSTLDTVAALGSVTSLGKSDSVDSGVASVSAGHQTNAAATSSRINRKKDGSGIAQALVRNVHETTVAPVFAIGAAAVAAEDDASSEFESRNKSKNMSSFKSRIKKSFGNRRPFRPRIYSDRQKSPRSADVDFNPEAPRSAPPDSKRRSLFRPFSRRQNSSDQESSARDADGVESDSDGADSTFSDISSDSVPKRDRIRNKIRRVKTRFTPHYSSGRFASRNQGDSDVETIGMSSNRKTVLASDAVDSAMSASGMSSGVLWHGKDYVNFIVKDVVRPDLPDADNVDRKQTPRMPWHDVATMVQGSAARDVGRHFIQRWNAVKTEKARHHSGFPYLIPKAYANFTPPPTVLNERSHFRGPRVKCQVLRSASDWSAGIEDTESSILSAYEAAIEKSEFYVYIENQFFITSSGGGGGEGGVPGGFGGSYDTNTTIVENPIGKALFERILRAHKEGASYRVYVLVPLLPAFEGDVGSGSVHAMHCVLHYQNNSIRELFERLERHGVSDPSKYLSFTSLRTWSELCGTPITELIYIHSKVLIADDKVVICGSANINDRSLLGNRDSEVCLRFEDVQTFVDVSLADGRTMRSGVFAGKLRRFLMREHLGLLPETGKSSGKSTGVAGRRRKISSLVANCVDDKFFQMWNQIAATNTEVFEANFHCVPSDEISSTEACRVHQKKFPFAEINTIMAKQNLQKQVQGSLVHLPWKFLRDSNLLPNINVKEGMVPLATWT